MPALLFPFVVFPGREERLLTKTVHEPDTLYYVVIVEAPESTKKATLIGHKSDDERQHKDFPARSFAHNKLTTEGKSLYVIEQPGGPIKGAVWAVDRDHQDLASGLAFEVVKSDGQWHRGEFIKERNKGAEWSLYNSGAETIWVSKEPDPTDQIEIKSNKVGHITGGVQLFFRAEEGANTVVYCQSY